MKMWFVDPIFSLEKDTLLVSPKSHTFVSTRASEFGMLLSSRVLHVRVRVLAWSEAAPQEKFLAQQLSAFGFQPLLQYNIIIPHTRISVRTPSLETE